MACGKGPVLMMVPAEHDRTRTGDGQGAGRSGPSEHCAQPAPGTGLGDYGGSDRHGRSMVAWNVLLWWWVRQKLGVNSLAFGVYQPA